MSKTNYYLLVLFGVIAVVGIWILAISPTWGLGEANNYLRNQAGGSMDTTRFTALVQSYQAADRWIGAILSSLGGAFFLRTLTMFVQPQK